MELAHVTGQPCGTDGTSRQAALARFWQAAGQSSDSFVRAGDDQREIGDWEQASAHYRRALLLNPQSAPAWYGQAEVFRARHQEGEALETFARVLALSSDPDLRAKTHNARGEILAGALLWSKASDELDHAVQLAPDQGLYHLNYGWYLHKAGDHPQQARAELTRAAGLLPENPLPHLRLADLDFADGDYAGMLVHAQTAIEIQPALFWSWVSQGRALRYLNRLAEGEQALRHAVELAPDEAVPRIELGHTFAQQGYWDRAINEYEQAILLAPGDLQHYMILGNAYRANGQRSQAVETYQSVLKLDPENAAARQALQELGH
jgi:tetratricopeptide (TPR) repeat protein